MSALTERQAKTGRQIGEAGTIINVADEVVLIKTATEATAVDAAAIEIATEAAQVVLEGAKDTDGVLKVREQSHPEDYPNQNWFTPTTGQAVTANANWVVGNLSQAWIDARGYGADKLIALKIVGGDAESVLSIRAVNARDNGLEWGWSPVAKQDGTDDLILSALTVGAGATVLLAIPKSFYSETLRLQFKATTAVTVTARCAMQRVG